MLSPEERAVLTAMRESPVYLRNGRLPVDSPSSRVLSELQARQLVILLHHNGDSRWAVSWQGHVELAK